MNRRSFSILALLCVTLLLPCGMAERQSRAGESVDCCCVKTGRLLGRRLRARRVRCCCTDENSTQVAVPEPVVESLFDGKTLGKWKPTIFGGQGDVYVEKGQMILEFGSSLTGVTYTGEVPTTNYEISLEAMRLEGIDFFCGLTFPVDKTHCSFIVAGWAGAIVGLSSIDDMDASDNETTQLMTFDNNRWYKIRVRVTNDHISAWIDEKQMVDQNIKDRRISTRPEVDLSKPLGLSSFDTRAAFRNITIRSIEAK